MRKTIVAILLSCTLTTNALAVSSPDHGWIPLRIDDGAPSHCINISAEAVTLDLRRLLVNAKEGWFTRDTEVDLLLKVQMSGSTSDQGSQSTTGSESSNKSLTLPRAYNAKLEGQGGLYSAGIEESVINEYPLKVGAQRITNLHVDVDLVNQQGTTVLSDVVKELLDITTNLPIPTGPFQQGFSYADKYANGILDKVTARQDVSKDLAKMASLQFNFAPQAGACSTGNGYETTGTKVLAAVVDSPADSKGVPDLMHPALYCFQVVTRPAYGIQFRHKPSSGICAAAAAAWTDLEVPYLALLLNADPVERAADERGAVVVRRTPESTARCAANGLKFSKCYQERSPAHER